MVVWSIFKLQAKSRNSEQYLLQIQKHIETSSRDQNLKFVAPERSVADSLANDKVNSIFRNLFPLKLKTNLKSVTELQFFS